MKRGGEIDLTGNATTRAFTNDNGINALRVFPGSDYNTQVFNVGDLLHLDVTLSDVSNIHHVDVNDVDLMKDVDWKIEGNRIVIDTLITSGQYITSPFNGSYLSFVDIEFSDTAARSATVNAFVIDPHSGFEKVNASDVSSSSWWVESDSNFVLRTSLPTGSFAVGDEIYVHGQLSNWDDFSRVDVCDINCEKGAEWNVDSSGRVTIRYTISQKATAAFFDLNFSSNISRSFTVDAYYIRKNAGGGDLKPSLPAGYAQVDYIESTGTQYIDTGVKASSSIGFDVTFLTNNIISGSYANGANNGFGSILGAYDEVNGQYLMSTYQQHTEGGFFWGGSHFSAQLSTGSKLNIVLNSQNRTYQNVTTGATEQVPNGEFSSSVTITLFGRNTASGITETSSTRFYAAKISMGGNWVRDFVPCIRESDGVAGLWDRVTGQFFGNAGTGNFIAGGGANWIDMDEIMAGFNAKTSSGAAMVKNNDGSYTWGGPTGHVGGEASNGPFLVPYELPYGTYRMRYDAIPSRDDDLPTTHMFVVDKNGVNICVGDEYSHKSKTHYEYTFTVDENFGGFRISWFYGDRTTFRNITLTRVDGGMKPESLLDMSAVMAYVNSKTSAECAMRHTGAGRYTWTGPTGHVGGSSENEQFIIPMKLEYGTYRLSYDCDGDDSSPGPTTALRPTDKNGIAIENGDLYGAPEEKHCEATFTVDENFGGFAIPWWNGYWTDFWNIKLEKI